MRLPTTQNDLVVLVSCASIWFFEPAQTRFCQVPRTGMLDISWGRWTPYHSLEIDTSGSFVVVFQEGCLQVHRVWLHADPCPHCDPAPGPEELAVEASPFVVG